MRVISGAYKGFQLTAPKSGTRPTTDRAKEGIFSHLESYGQIEDAQVLDLFAGTGALGIEALSRGAAGLVAVESASQAASLLRNTFSRLKRLSSWDAASSARTAQTPAEKFVRTHTAKDRLVPGFDIVFIDPPYAYASQDCDVLLQELVSGSLVSSHTVIVLERSERSTEPTIPHGWAATHIKNYGETKVFFIETA